MQSVGMNSITGVASGLDTNSIVEALIAVQRGDARLFESRVAETTNMVSTYQAIEAKLLGIQARLGSLGKDSTFDKMNFGVSDPEAVTVGLNGESATGSFDMRVLQLAKNHQIASQGVADADAAILGTGLFKLSVGSTSIQAITIDETNNSLSGLKDAINEANVGVTATIINDGSGENTFRMILSSDKTGYDNRINVETSLAGGVTPNFATAQFDIPETNSFSALASSSVKLGSTAAYTGAENKTFTFTVTGTGTQSVGTDIITLDWTDGVNSGSIIVTQADTEVTLSGAGADGLTLDFSAGDLIAGDTFDVQTFAPVLQNPGDAKISVGSSASGGAPITISSATNTFEESLPGMSLTVNKLTEPGEVITITASRDTDGVKQEIQGFIDAYNDAMKFIDGQFSFDPSKGEGGILMSEGLLRVMQESVRSSATGIVRDLSSKFTTLATIGIRSDGKGLLKIADSTRLEDAIKNDSAALRRLFVSDIASSSEQIEFLAAPDGTKDGRDYLVDITQAATSGYLESGAITDPSSTPVVIDANNKTFQLKVDGRLSDDLVISEGSYTSYDQLVRELQSRIDADEKIGTFGVKVSVDTESGKITFSSATYGSNSAVEYMSDANYIAANGILGFVGGTLVTGLDVAGTINGEEADGTGRTLTGKNGNETTEGVKLKILFGPADLVEGSEGSFKFTKGIAARVKDTIFRITDSSSGSLSRRTKALSGQIEEFQEQIRNIDERLQLKRRRLIEQFQAMEQVLGQLNAQSSYLSNQLANLNRNFDT